MRNHIYTTPELREQIFAILEEVLSEHQIEGKNRQGRPTPITVTAAAKQCNNGLINFPFGETFA